MTRLSSRRGWAGIKLRGADMAHLLSEADIVPLCLRRPDGAVLGLNRAYSRLVGTRAYTSRRHLPDGKWRHASYTVGGGRRVHALIASAVLPGKRGLELSFVIDVTRLKEEHLRLRQHLRLADELYRIGYASTLEHLSSWLIHELSQPLMATFATAQGSRRLLARRGPRLPEIGEAIEAITRYQRRAAEVLGRLRCLLPKSEPRRAHLNVNELILEAVGFLKERGDLKGMSVRVSLTRKLLFVDGVREALRQVFLNLLLSALEAMHATPVRRRKLSIRAAPRKARTQLHVIIRDNGMEVRRPDCMEFAAALARSAPSAAALGLPVAGVTVVDHGGRIWLKKRRRGAEYHVILPVVLPK